MFAGGIISSKYPASLRMFLNIKTTTDTNNNHKNRIKLPARKITDKFRVRFTENLKNVSDKTVVNKKAACQQSRVGYQVCVFTDEIQAPKE